jgi:hypothetical protein
MALRNNGPKAFREVFLPSSGPGGYLSPTVATLQIMPSTLFFFDEGK